MKNPDQKHQDYFEQHPNGNHDSMSKETLQALNILEQKIEGKIDDLKENFNTKLESKVSFAWLWSVLGILSSVVAGMFYLVYNQNINTQEQIKQVDQKTTLTNDKTIEIGAQLKALDLIK